MLRRLRFVAATTRTSTLMRHPGRRPVRPTRSCSTRSSFACAVGDRSPTSSRNSVPLSASSNLPRRPLTPVAVRSSMPNSSASSSVSTSAAQLTATNGPRCRWLPAWISRATSSLPAPLSPSTSTVKFVSAMRASLRAQLLHQQTLAHEHRLAPKRERTYQL